MVLERIAEQGVLLALNCPLAEAETWKRGGGHSHGGGNQKCMDHVAVGPGSCEERVRSVGWVVEKGHGHGVETANQQKHKT